MKLFNRIGIAIGVAAAAVMTLAPLAMAGVVNSNHDMIFKNTYSGAAAKGGACSFCHIPHKAGGAKLWSSVPEVGTGWRAEPITQLCYSCHAYGTYAGAREMNPWEDTVHGRTVATLTTTFGDATSAELATNGVVLGLNNDLKCTSCHDVHNNDSRPFLKFVPASSFAFNTFCETCHIHRANAIGQETLNVVPNASSVNFSQHPTDQVLGNTGDTQEGFVAFAAEFAIVPGANNVPGVAGIAGWNLGGHRNDGTAGGNFGCATCHAVHGNETADFTAADGATVVNPAVINNFNYLAVRNTNPGTTNASICTGCHASTMPVGPGAGGVSHPVGTSSSAWTITLGITTSQLFTNIGSKWGTNGSDDVIVCQSCHDMHYATTASSLLRGTLDQPTASSNSNCNQCHLNSSQSNHHPSGVAYNGIASPVTQTGAMTWSTLTKGPAGLAYAFSAGATGTMTCGTCHGGAADAHNNVGQFPTLSGYNASSEMCFDCHTANPSTYTTNTHLSALEAGSTDTSHYVGTIMTTPGYKRTTAWTNGRLSKWGDSGNAIICESCHTLTFKGTIPAVSSNTAVANSVQDSVGLLLEPSGNLTPAFYGTAPAGSGPDLCTGCHGGQPSGGAAGAGAATHPAISTGYTGPVPVAMTTRMALAANAGMVTLNSNSLPNCESCHRPHDAAQGSGALILEGVGTDSVKLFNQRATGNDATTGYANEAPFCNMCHNY